MTRRLLCGEADIIEQQQLVPRKRRADRGIFLSASLVVLWGALTSMTAMFLLWPEATNSEPHALSVQRSVGASAVEENWRVPRPESLLVAKVPPAAASASQPPPATAAPKAEQEQMQDQEEEEKVKAAASLATAIAQQLRCPHGMALITAANDRPSLLYRPLRVAGAGPSTAHGYSL